MMIIGSDDEITKILQWLSNEFVVCDLHLFLGILLHQKGDVLLLDKQQYLSP